MNEKFKNNQNREFKKDRQRNYHSDAPKNMTVEIPVSCYGITMDGKEYNGISFMNMMESLQNNNTFTKISIPVYTKASYANDNPESKWNIIIGYIKNFDTENGTATCVIYSKSIKTYEKIKNAIIIPRVAIKQGECVCILGLDIANEKDIKK